MKKIMVMFSLVAPLILSCGTNQKVFMFNELETSKAKEIYLYDKEFKVDNPGQDYFKIDYMMEGGSSFSKEIKNRFYSYRRKNLTNNDQLYLTYINEEWIDSTLRAENIQEIKKEVFGGTIIDLNNKSLVNGKYVKLHKHLTNSKIDNNVKIFKVSIDRINDIKFEDNGYLLSNVVRETTSIFETNLSTKEELNKKVNYLVPVSSFDSNTIKEQCVVPEGSFVSVMDFDIKNQTLFDEYKIFEEAPLVKFNNVEAITFERYVQRNGRIDLLEKEFSSCGFDTQYDFYHGFKDLLLDAYLGDVGDNSNQAYFQLDKLVAKMK